MDPQQPNQPPNLVPNPPMPDTPPVPPAPPVAAPTPPEPLTPPVYQQAPNQPMPQMGQPMAPPASTNEATDKALKATHTAGGWALGVGILYLLIEIPVQLLLNSGSNKVSTAAAILLGAVFALLFGGSLTAFGIKLRKARLDTLLQADKLLLYVLILLIVLLVISLLSGSGAGLLNLLLLLFVVKARSAIKRCKTA